MRDFTNNSLRHVFDCVSVESSFRIDAAALSRDARPEQLHCLALLPPDGWPAERKNVNVRWILAYTSFGEAFSKPGTDWPVVHEHYEMGWRFWALNAGLLREGRVRPHPVTVNDGGLLMVPDG